MMWVAVCFSFVTHLTGCPTCVGRLDKGDDPFFTDRYYQHITNSANAMSQDNVSEIEDELGDDNEESD